MKKGIKTWFNELRVGDVVETAYGKEVIRKKYDDMLGFDANGRTNLNADGLYPIAISGCRPIENNK